jgi:hypothetical protein
MIVLLISAAIAVFVSCYFVRKNLVAVASLARGLGGAGPSVRPSHWQRDLEAVERTR